MKITARTGATWGGVAGLGSLRRKLVRAVSWKLSGYRLMRSMGNSRRTTIAWLFAKEPF